MKRLTVSLLLVIISGCVTTPDVMIVSVGSCEHGVVGAKNVSDVQKIWPEAQIADVLISGGCYQDMFIKKTK